MGVKKFYRPILSYDGQMIDGGGSGPSVESVNGQTGAVTLNAADVGALPDTYVPPTAPVASVNGKTGAVTLNAADVGALPDTYTPPVAPVASVNGKTGTVTLNAADVGALSTASAPTAVSRGGIMIGAGVADAVDETDVVAQFNALLQSLRENGVIVT